MVGAIKTPLFFTSYKLMQLTKENMIGMIGSGKNGNDILAILDLIETEYNSQIQEESSSHQSVSEVEEYQF